VGQQEARFETDIVETRGRQRRRCIAQQTIVGRPRPGGRTGGQAASSASRPASSSAVSASMNSSSPRPSITSSSL
jgi:hypothetical protein